MIHKNPSNSSQAVLCGRTASQPDMTMLIVVFLNFSDVHKMLVLPVSITWMSGYWGRYLDLWRRT